MTGGDLILVVMVGFGGLVVGGVLGFGFRDDLFGLIAKDWEAPARWDAWGR